MLKLFAHIFGTSDSDGESSIPESILDADHSNIQPGPSPYPVVGGTKRVYAPSHQVSFTSSSPVPIPRTPQRARNAVQSTPPNRGNPLPKPDAPQRPQVSRQLRVEPTPFPCEKVLNFSNMGDNSLFVPYTPDFSLLEDHGNELTFDLQHETNRISVSNVAGSVFGASSDDLSFSGLSDDEVPPLAEVTDQQKEKPSSLSDNIPKESEQQNRSTDQLYIAAEVDEKVDETEEEFEVDKIMDVIRCNGCAKGFVFMSWKSLENVTQAQIQKYRRAGYKFYVTFWNTNPKAKRIVWEATWEHYSVIEKTLKTELSTHIREKIPRGLSDLRHFNLMAKACKCTNHTRNRKNWVHY